MSEQEYRADWIEVIEKGAFKTEHTFHSKAGVLGLLRLKGGKDRGSFFPAEGGSLEYIKPRVFKSEFELREGDEILARAASRGALRRALNITYDGRVYGLLPGGKKYRSWLLKSSQEQVVCEFQPRGTFKRGARIRIRSQVPLNLLVFSYCLVVKRWAEESSG